jgi:hypothetical protein
MTTNKIISLKIVTAPATGIVLDAPPVLIASDHSVDYTCGRCSTILLHAEEGQVRGFASAADTADPNLKTRLTHLAAVWTQLAIDREDPKTRRPGGFQKCKIIRPLN